MTVVPESSVLESWDSRIENDQEPSLPELQQMVSPTEISYFSEWWSLGTVAMWVCRIIWALEDREKLDMLLQHTKTLHALPWREFPIDRIQRAITKRLWELRV